MKRVTFLVDNEDHEILKKWCEEDGYEDNLSLYIRQMIHKGHKSMNKDNKVQE